MSMSSVSFSHESTASLKVLLENAAKRRLRRIHALDISPAYFSPARLSAPAAFVLYTLDRVGARERETERERRQDEYVLRLFLPCHS